jgi:hypothetical protein
MAAAARSPARQGLRMGVRDNWMLWMYAANRRCARCAWRAAECVGVKSLNLWADRRGAGQRERDSHGRHHPGRAQLGLVLSPIVAASGNTPIGPSARPPPNDCLEMRMEHGLHAQWSGAALLAIPRPSTNVLGFQCPHAPLARPTPAGRYRVNWNVGLDYTAHPANCQSANAFVEPRQTRAPRLRNAPSKTAPRSPSHPPANRASSRPCSAPSTIA